MWKYEFSLIHIFLYKDRIYDFVLVRENTGQWKLHLYRQAHLLQKHLEKSFYIPKNVDLMELEGRKHKTI